MDNSTSYIPVSNISLAKELAKKKELQLKLNVLKDKAYSLETIINYPSTAENHYNAFRLNPRISTLLDYKVASDNINQWENDPFNQNPKYPEQLTFPCPSGNIVRSKSEVFIDMALNANQIPYRYECELKLGQQTFYPDFTLMHPLSGELLYWEHFGLMNNDDYAYSAFNKLKLYYNHGIIPGSNLIITFESKNKPFTYTEAEAALSFLLI